MHHKSKQEPQVMGHLQVPLGVWCGWCLLCLWWLVLVVPVVSGSGGVELFTNGAIVEGISVVPSIIAIVAIIVGAAMALFGYKWYRRTMFVSGFLVGGFSIAICVESIVSGGLASWIAFFVGGTLVGTLVVRCYRANMTIVGAAAGILVGFLFGVFVGFHILPGHPGATFVVSMIVMPFLCAYGTWKIKKPAVIVSTSFIGAQAVTWGVGYFAGTFPAGEALKKFQEWSRVREGEFKVPSAWWGYWGASVVLWGITACMQFLWTAKKKPSRHPPPMSRVIPHPESPLQAFK